MKSIHFLFQPTQNVKKFFIFTKLHQRDDEAVRLYFVLYSVVYHTDTVSEWVSFGRTYQHCLQISKVNLFIALSCYTFFHDIFTCHPGSTFFFSLCESFGKIPREIDRRENLFYGRKSLQMFSIQTFTLSMDNMQLEIGSIKIN